MKILKEFYYGNIRPSEQCVKTDSEYDRMRKEWLGIYDELTQNHSKNESEKINELIDLQGRMSEIAAAENYMQGFRHGAEMILDVLFGESENLK